jgi:hypothetical protein
MSNLINAPTFIYRQGKFADDTFKENPIQITYYSNGVELRQEGEFEQDETIIISYDHLKKLFKAIEKNQSTALSCLQNKTN